MKKLRIVDVIDSDVAFQVEENSEVDNEHILAKVKGVFFCPDGKSRNSRYYSRSLWEKALKNPDVQNKLKSRTMFGTLGHETELNDKAIQEGRISHIISDAYIDKDGKGIGEALILNTPAGKVLNTILRAGSKVFVSSRAEGRFKGTKDGMPIVDEDAYKLDTWDFVLNPGFKQASPLLAEALEDIDKNIQGDTTMDEALKKVMSENFDLKSQLEAVTNDKKTIEESVKPLEEENAHVKEQLVTAEESIKTLEETATETNTKLEEATAEVAIINEIGDNAVDVKEALTKAVDYIETLHEEIGTREEIESTLNDAISFKEEMDKIGTPEEIKKVLEYGDTMLDEKILRERNEKIETLSKELNVETSVVEKLMDKDMSEEEIKEFLGALTKTLKVEEAKINEDETEEVLDEGDDVVSTTVTRTRLNRIMEQFGN